MIVCSYQSDFILYPSVVRSRSLQQILQEVKLKGHTAAKSIPSIMLSLTKNKVGVCTELPIVLSYALERAYSHAQSLVNVNAMSRNFVQARVIGLDRCFLSPFVLHAVSKEVSQRSTYCFPLANVVSD